MSKEYNSRLADSPKPPKSPNRLKLKNRMLALGAAASVATVGGVLGYGWVILADAQYEKKQQKEQELKDAIIDDGFAVDKVRLGGSRDYDRVDIILGSCTLTGVSVNYETNDDALDVYSYEIPLWNGNGSFITIANASELEAVSSSIPCAGFTSATNN